MIYLKEGHWPLSLAFDDEIIQEANNTYQLSFKFPVTENGWEELRPEVVLLADDLHGEQEFVIFEVTKKHGFVQIYANQVMTLLNGYAIRSISVDRVPGQTVMSALAGAIRRQQPFSFFSDIASRHTFNEKDVSVMDALTKGKHSIIGQWGGDLIRDKYAVRLLANGGRESEALFMFKKNLTNYEDNQSVKNLRTRIHFKKVIQGEQGHEDRILAVTVDSPLIGQYREIYEGNVEVTDQDIVDEAGLLAYGKSYYGRTLCDVVESSLTLAVDGEPDVPVRLFDVVSVHHERFGVDLRLKITSYRYAPMGKRLKAIGFGKIKTSLAQQVSSLASEQASKVAGAMADDVDRRVQKQMDNMNREIDQRFENSKQAIVDGIEEAKAAAEVVKAEVSSEVEAVAREGQAVKQAVEAGLAEADRKAKAFESDVRSRVGQIETKANQVADQARQSDQKADQALTKAGASENLAQTAKDTADRAIRQAGDNLRTAQERANQLQEDLDAAKRTITSQARDILDQAQAQSDLSRKVQTVEETANGTRTTVTELTKTVNANTGNLTSVTERVASTESDLTNVRNQYSTLKTTVDDQSGKVTSLERQTADLSSGLDGVKERFEKIRIGAVNYLKNSDFSKQGEHWSQYQSQPFGLNFNFEHSQTNKQLPGIHFWYGQTNTAPFYGVQQLFDFSGSQEEELTVSFLVATDGNNAPRSGLRVGLHYRRSNVIVGQDWKQVTSFDIRTNYKRFQFTFVLPADVDALNLMLFGEEGRMSNIYLAQIQLERGNVATDWHPAEEDFRQEFATYIRNASENSASLERKIETADGKAESAKTQAQQTADSLELKAEKTDLDTVSGRVDTAEATIELHAKALTQRLTSTQVDSLVAGKGYQTKDDVDANITGRGYITNAALDSYVPTTTFNNYKRETSESIERELTATRALIPKDFGGVNLVRNGAFPERLDHWSGSRDAFLVTQHSFYYGGQKKLFRLQTAYANEVTAGTNRFPVKRNTDYTLSFVGFAGSNVSDMDVWFLARQSGQTANFTHTNAIISRRRLSPSKIERVSVTFNSGNNDEAFLRFDNNGSSNGSNAVLFFGEVMLVEGATAQNWSPAHQDLVTSVDFNKVQETAQLYERIIGKTEGDITANLARQVMTSELYQTEVTRANWDTRNYVKNGAFLRQREEWNEDIPGSGLSVSYDKNQTLGRSGIRISGTANARFKGIHQRLKLSLVAGQKVTVSALIGQDNFRLSQLNIGLHFIQGQTVHQAWKNVDDRTVEQGRFTRHIWTVSVPANCHEVVLWIQVEPNQYVNYYLTEIALNVSDRFVGYAEAIEDHEAMSTKVSQLADSYGIKILGNKEKILSELNLNSNGVRIAGKLIHLDGEVTANEAFFRSILTDRIEAGYLKAGAVTTEKLAANAVTAAQLSVDRALIDKLVANQLWAERLFAQEGFVQKLKATEFSAGQITSGTLSSRLIAADSITADKLKVDQAFFTKLMADEAYLKQLFAKQAFITQVQSVEVIADKIRGGNLQALNGAMTINLNRANITFNQNATFDFNSSNNALVRRRGTHTAFLHFVDEPKGGVYAGLGVTSSGDGINSSSSGRYAGLRIFRTSVGGTNSTRHEAAADQIELYGDNILLQHAFDGSGNYLFQPTKLDKQIDMNTVINMVLSVAHCIKLMRGTFDNMGNPGLKTDIDREINGFLSAIDTYPQNRIHRG